MRAGARDVREIPKRGQRRTKQTRPERCINMRCPHNILFTSLVFVSLVSSESGREGARAVDSPHSRRFPTGRRRRRRGAAHGGDGRRFHTAAASTFRTSSLIYIYARPVSVTLFLFSPLGFIIQDGGKETFPCRRNPVAAAAVIHHLRAMKIVSARRRPLQIEPSFKKRLAL